MYLLWNTRRSRAPSTFFEAAVKPTRGLFFSFFLLIVSFAFFFYPSLPVMAKKTADVYMALRDELRENLEFLAQKLTIKICIQFDRELKQARTHTQQRRDTQERYAEAAAAAADNTCEDQDTDASMAAQEDYATAAAKDPVMASMVATANDHERAIEDARQAIRKARHSKSPSAADDLAWAHQACDDAIAARNTYTQRATQQTNMLILEQFQKRIHTKQWTSEWYEGEHVLRARIGCVASLLALTRFPPFHQGRVSRASMRFTH
jgi:hypothetical protein